MKWSEKDRKRWKKRERKERKREKKRYGGRLLSPRRVMLRLVDLLGVIRDLQECSRELPGTLWGALGELSGSSWGALGTSWGALGRLLGAFWVRKSSSVAESLLFRESSSRLHGSIDFEV